MSETTAGVKWEEYGQRENGVIYRGDAFTVRVHNKNWWMFENGESFIDIYERDFATAMQQAERWIMEREGRLPAPATDGGWIACSERMPEVGQRVQVIHERQYTGHGWWTNFGVATHWRPLPFDPHADAACLFDDDQPTLEQARTAARHVAGCAECRERLEEKGGA